MYTSFNLGYLMPTDLKLLEYAMKAYDTPNIECGNGASAWLHISSEYIVIAPAGTDSVLDALIDIWAPPWKPEAVGEWVHRGVWLQTSALAAEIVPRLEGSSLPWVVPIYITGHSLGGGIAQVLTSLLLKRGFEVARLTTFGSMKSGFEGLNKITREVEGRRYVRDGDTVPELPPLFYTHDRPATILEGDESVFGDHNFAGYKEALEMYNAK